MTRFVPALIAEVLVTIALALVLLIGWQWILSSDLVDALGQGAYLLFYFNDVAMLVWIAVLIVSAVRRRRLPGIPITLLGALLGVVVNVVMVAAIGFAQQGWFAFYVLFAVEAGFAFLVAAVVAVPIVHRIARPARVAAL